MGEILSHVIQFLIDIIVLYYIYSFISIFLKSIIKLLY